MNADDAWLVMDRDGDAVIEDGTELFGNLTPQPPTSTTGRRRNGFAALAVLDENRDERVDARDREFARLRLWRDVNHDGVSQASELSTLSATGIEGISVVYREAPDTDAHGNHFLYHAEVFRVAGAKVGMTAWDVVVVATIPEPLVAPSADVALARPQEMEGCAPVSNSCTKTDVQPPSNPTACNNGYAMCTQCGDQNLEELWVAGTSITCNRTCSGYYEKCVQEKCTNKQGQVRCKAGCRNPGCNPAYPPNGTNGWPCNSILVG